MSALAEEFRTFRGESLEELLPQIREELGADAVILRRREGIVGGIGGFFGKRCLEVDARSAHAGEALPHALPPAGAFSAYDTGDDDEAPGTSTLMDELLAQASPFADVLSDAVRRGDDPAPADEAPASAVEAAPDPAPAPEVPEAEEAPVIHIHPLRPVENVRAALERALVPPAEIEAILAEVAELRVFAPTTPDKVLARRALARRMRIRHRGRARRRRIALVGAPGAGRTAAAARLCNALGRGDASVCAVAHGSARDAMPLALATDAHLEVADRPQVVSLLSGRLRRYDVVVADLNGSFEDAAALAAALKPTETHLVVSAAAGLASTRLLAEEVRSAMKVDQLLVTHLDGARPCPAAGLSLWLGLPVSYLSEGDDADGGIRPAEPDELARLALP